MRRGELWWANLPPPSGSEPGYRRPVLIVQADVFNRSGIHTTIAVPLTSNLRLAQAPGNVLLTARETDLSKDSVANVSQLAAIDRTRLAERIGSVPAHLLRRVEEGLRAVLSL